MGSILSISGLITGLRNGPRIVDDISFDIRAGETFALLGESGCGKSMTALSLMRLLPDGVVNAGGAAQLEGVALFELREREMRDVRGGKMAMIFQEPGLSLNPVMMIGQQIVEVLALHTGLVAQPRNSAAWNCLIRWESLMPRDVLLNTRSSFPAA